MTFTFQLFEVFNKFYFHVRVYDCFDDQAFVQHSVPFLLFPVVSYLLFSMVHNISLDSNYIIRFSPAYTFI